MSEVVHAADLPGTVAWVAQRLGVVSRDGSVRVADLRAIPVGRLVDIEYLTEDQLSRFVSELGAFLLSRTTTCQDMVPPEDRTAAPAAAPRTRSAAQERRHLLTNRILDHLLLRPGSTMDEVAAALGEDVAAVTAAAGPVDWLILDANDIVEEGHRAESAAVAATRARALAALQAASLLVAPLSHQNYTSLVRGGRVSGPSVARIVQLFGSWTSACAQAGVRSGDALRRHYSRTWSHEAVIGHVSSFLLEPAHRGASNRYDVWRAARGSKSTPSLGTVRNMCGARWHDIRTAALRSMRAGWAGGGAPA